MQVLRRRPTEQYGDNQHQNEFNVQPQVIPDWLQDWLENRGGYLIGNMRTGRPDFRFYSLGNSLGLPLRTSHSPTTACTVSPHPSQPQSSDGSDADADLPSTHGNVGVAKQDRIGSKELAVELPQWWPLAEPSLVFRGLDPPPRAPSSQCRHPFDGADEVNAGGLLLEPTQPTAKAAVGRIF